MPSPVTTDAYKAGVRATASLGCSSRLRRRCPATVPADTWLSQEAGRVGAKGRTSTVGDVMDVAVLQGALRLLFLLDAAGVPMGGGATVPPDALKVVRSEKRMQAMDFWMRNPDYLAAEILVLVQANRFTDADVPVAQGLLNGDEPDLRRYPMVRYLFGAFEPIDDAFSMLVTPGLAARRRAGNPQGRKSSNFYLLQAGADAAAQIVADDPDLIWYRDRAALVARVAGNDSGNRLKERQYAHAQYAETQIGTRFAPITEIVRQRLADHLGVTT